MRHAVLEPFTKEAIELELFVGLIQAFIFAMLTLVFAATATVLHDSEGH